MLHFGQASFRVYLFQMPYPEKLRLTHEMSSRYAIANPAGPRNREGSPKAIAVDEALA